VSTIHWIALVVGGAAAMAGGSSADRLMAENVTR